MADQEWKTVDTFSNLTEAFIARGALEAADIPCFLRDENTVRIDWGASIAIGGMRLQVPADRYTEALDTLHSLELPPDEDPAAP